MGRTSRARIMAKQQTKAELVEENVVLKKKIRILERAVLSATTVAQDRPLPIRTHDRLSQLVGRR